LSQSRPRLLLHAFSTFKLGGPQARFVQLANSLGPGYQHVVAAMDNCFDAGDRLDPGIRWEPMRLDVRKGGLMANRKGLRKVLQETRPDLLLTYNWGAIEWAAANLPRLVSHVHVEDGFGPDEAVHQLPRRVWMRRFLLGINRVPVVVASHNLQRIATEVWKLAPRRVRYLANGVAAMPAQTPAPQASARGKPVCIGTLAGLRPEKNIARLLRAFAQVVERHEARLVIVGDGPLRSELEALARTLKIADQVEFAGYLTDPASRLAEFDLFALSSDTEQLPLAMLEAMAHGVPVVATRVGDIPHVLDGVAPENLSAPDDAAFSRTLLAAVDNDVKWPAWSSLGRARIQQAYSEEQMLSGWKQVFDGRLS
jgi:glycosyltransferase involved in cell wall biosynthesis